MNRFDDNVDIGSGNLIDPSLPPDKKPPKPKHKVTDPKDFKESTRKRNLCPRRVLQPHERESGEVWRETYTHHPKENTELKQLIRQFEIRRTVAAEIMGVSKWAVDGYMRRCGDRRYRECPAHRLSLLVAACRTVQSVSMRGD